MSNLSSLDLFSVYLFLAQAKQALLLALKEEQGMRFVEDFERRVWEP
jgi:hypothetical protein